MIVSITGGRGFIGQCLVNKHINQKDEVRVLSRSNISNTKGTKVFIGDLTNVNEDFSEFVDGADVVYHCAGEYKDESLMYNLHVDGTQRLLNFSNGKIT
jgi:nucleoside-diphosphate-sugar epimerase